MKKHEPDKSKKYGGAGLFYLLGTSGLASLVVLWNMAGGQGTRNAILNFIDKIVPNNSQPPAGIVLDVPPLPRLDPAPKLADFQEVAVPTLMPDPTEQPTAEPTLVPTLRSVVRPVEGPVVQLKAPNVLEVFPYYGGSGGKKKAAAKAKSGGSAAAAKNGGGSKPKGGGGGGGSPAPSSPPPSSPPPATGGGTTKSS
jgi:hypothetical protein